MAQLIAGSASSNVPAVDTEAIVVGADFHTPAQPVVFTLKVPFHLDHRKWSQPVFGRWAGIFVSALGEVGHSRRRPAHVEAAVMALLTRLLEGPENCTGSLCRVPQRHQNPRSPSVVRCRPPAGRTPVLGVRQICDGVLQMRVDESQSFLLIPSTQGAE